MQSDNQKPQVGYFHRALIDGLTPFRYRSRVRSLLGIPDAKPDKGFASKIIPPVGFRYASQPIFAGVQRTNQFAEAATRKNFPLQMSNDRRKPDKLYLESDQQAALANDLDGLFKNKVEKIRTPKDSMQYERLSESLEPESKDNNTNIERMVIPGISNNKKSFFPSFQAEEEVPLLSKKVRKVHQTKETSIGERIKEVGKPKLESKIDSQTYKEEKVEGWTASANSKNLVKNRTFSQPQKTLFFEKKGAELSQLEPKPTFTEHRNFNSKARFTSEAIEKIDQLRHSVHEIAKKTSIQTKEKFSELNQQSAQKTASPLPSSQPVIIYKQTSYKAKAPCAFWERSYLNRINIRTLR